MKICEKNRNEIRNFLCGAAAPHPAWGCRPRPRLGLSPQTPGFETPPYRAPPSPPQRPSTSRGHRRPGGSASGGVARVRGHGVGVAVAVLDRGGGSARSRPRGVETSSLLWVRHD